MVEGQAHVNFTELDAGMQKTLESVVDITLPNQNLIEDYTGALLVAFFEVYIADNEKFCPFLLSSYAEYLSQGQKFKLDFITAASDEKLSQLFRIVRMLAIGKRQLSVIPVQLRINTVKGRCVRRPKFLF
jgi:hypothetical protein